MRGTSGASLAAAQERFEPVLRSAGTEAATLGEQLFAVVSALDGSAPLRRSLADPSRDGEDKARLVTAVLADGFDERVVDLVSGLVRSRWSSDADLGDAVERLAVDAMLAAAESRGALETVEDELFVLTRALVGQRAARQALSDETSAREQRVGLVEALLAGKADEITVALARRATTSLRGRRFVPTLVWYGDVAAERRNRLVASVTSGSVLSAAQEERLGEILERAYGRAVQLNVTVDPAVVGGLRIQVGADVVDSTVLSRLADARRRLAG
ncbi:MULTISPECIES: F0F1 ATP synthase subunit delta [Isoptericola]|uniref:ATP synthase subunit delta n=1 Tax=Isoptericola sediminis TaxID=2733572 RepID=A0A849JZZ8_9MICO|nr:MULTISPECIES: F0F1 ATP synthase subunit delta [Isoptericola]MDO8143026.1 F0F1 ATP synthase subunit delta [Isoptericola sp. 178]MDO8146887.1 F0F1 ATP synthase subunit delta [Isoptericola sp. b515]MDO8150798.1 F0F1 ATP synthase subunit delta [Isoptericola sp. b408]NNU25981.1 F0F1 ATP synthase subunit delta [Isoptericola sediminis]